MFPNVQPVFFGTTTPPPSPRKVTEAPSSELLPQATPSASIGTSQSPAARLHTPPGIIVPDAETTATEPKAAASPSPRLSTATPYLAHGWLAALTSNNLLDKYRHISTSIQHSFNAGIKYISSTFTPLNNESASLLHDVFQKSVSHKFTTGRYEGPFTRQQIENILGPFQTSPISIVPKPNKPGKYCIIQNFSSPYPGSGNGPSAINTNIISSHFPYTRGTFETICSTILHLPPGSQAAVRDVAEAYRTIPLKPSQWPGTVVRLSQSKFAIDKCLMFDCSSSADVYGNLADASADIFRAEGIGPVSKWVDDFVFFRIPTFQISRYNLTCQELHATITTNGGSKREGGHLLFKGPEWPDGFIEEFDDSCQIPIKSFPTNSQEFDAPFAYTINHIDAISDKLRIPWERSKDQPFSPHFTYLGFLWNVDDKLVSLTDHKREKYCRAIREWNESARHPLQETEKLHGKLLHVTHIIPKGQAYLLGLERLMAMQHNKPHTPLTPPKGTAFELDWWLLALSSPSPIRPIPSPSPLVDLSAFSDASSGVGLAFLVGKKWKAWHLLPGWQSDGRDIAWAESITLELMAQAVVVEHGQHNLYKLHCDNRVVVNGWPRGRSHNRHVNATFRRLHDLSEQTHSRFIIHYVPSALNPADGPSRGQFPQYPPSFGSTLPDPSISNFFIDATLPRTQREIRAVRAGTNFSPQRPPRLSTQPPRNSRSLNKRERRDQSHL